MSMQGPPAWPPSRGFYVGTRGRRSQRSQGLLLEGPVTTHLRQFPGLMLIVIVMWGFVGGE